MFRLYNVIFKKNCIHFVKWNAILNPVHQRNIESCIPQLSFDLKSNLKRCKNRIFKQKKINALASSSKLSGKQLVSRQILHNPFLVVWWFAFRKIYLISTVWTNIRTKVTQNESNEQILDITLILALAKMQH